MMDKYSNNTVAMAENSENKDWSALERLPAELQNRIFALAVADGRDIDLSSTKHQPALAATNSEIRKRVLPIFYGGNTFIIALVRGKEVDLDAVQAILDQYAAYWKFIKSVGATGGNPNIRSRGFLKIDARHLSENGVSEIEFSGVAASTSPCMCALANLTGSAQHEHDQESLTKALLLACVTDLNKTIMQTVKSMLFNNLGMSYLADENGANCYSCSHYLLNHVNFT